LRSRNCLPFRKDWDHPYFVLWDSCYSNFSFLCIVFLIIACRILFWPLYVISLPLKATVPLNWSSIATLRLHSRIRAFHSDIPNRKGYDYRLATSNKTSPITEVKKISHHISCYIMATSFSGGRSRSTRREALTMDKQLVNFITCDCESSASFL
jgi:hypothetical protein